VSRLYGAFEALLSLDVHDALAPEGIHAAHQNVANQIGILQQGIYARPDGLEELVAPFITLIETHAVEPGLLLTHIQILQPFELGLAARIERVELARLNILEKQECLRGAELVVPIGRAVHDAHPCVIDVAAPLRGHRGIPEPLRTHGAPQMVVQVPPFGHGIEKLVELHGGRVSLDLLEPALGSPARLDAANI